MTLGANVPSSPALQVVDLSVCFGEIVAVDAVSFHVAPGEIVALLGPNGAGKTTTLRCLEGFCTPTAGSVAVASLHPQADHDQIVRLLGVMVQGGGVYPAMRVRETLELYAAYYDNPRSVDELSSLLGLDHLATTTWRRLSGGEQQRLSLALALVGNPSILIVDEPTAGVDPEGRLVIRDVLRDLRSQGVAILMTSHELSEVDAIADRLVLLSKGRVIASGTQSELMATTQAQASFETTPGLDGTALSSALGVHVSEGPPGHYRLDATFDGTQVGRLVTALSDLGASLDGFSAGGTLEDLYHDLYRGEPRAMVEPARTTRRRR